MSPPWPRPRPRNPAPPRNRILIFYLIFYLIFNWFDYFFDFCFWFDFVIDLIFYLIFLKISILQSLPALAVSTVLKNNKNNKNKYVFSIFVDFWTLFNIWPSYEGFYKWFWAIFIFRFFSRGDPFNTPPRWGEGGGFNTPTPRLISAFLQNIQFSK